MAEDKVPTDRPGGKGKPEDAWGFARADIRVPAGVDPDDFSTIRAGAVAPPGPTEPTEPPRAPKPLAGYRPIAILGRGGFGEVWKAEGPGGVPVALKFVHMQDKQGAIELRALETVKGIRHPNLLSPFGTWKVDDYLIIGMELADGTLMDHLDRARADGQTGIPRDELIEYFAEAAKGIDYLNKHKHTIDDGRCLGVQHRDIKPQNILLVGGGVKVADFGLARLLERSITAHSGSMTPAYSPPEFFKSQTSDHSDQYSLAVSYCQLRGGRLPFTGSMEAIITGHMFRPPDLTMLPMEERRIVGRALAKKPADRWPDCRAFVSALADSAPRRGRRLAAAAGLLLAIPIAGLAAWQFRPGDSVPIISRPPDLDRTPPIVDKPKPKPDPDPKRSAPIIIVDKPKPDPTTTLRTLPSVKPDGPNLAEFLERGRLAFAEAKFEAALEAYSEAILLDPKNVAAINNRGSAYYKLGDPDAAVEDFNRAIALDPKEASPYFNRGNAHFSLRRYQEAMTDFREALRIDPNHADARANLDIATRKAAE